MAASAVPKIYLNYSYIPVADHCKPGFSSGEHLKNNVSFLAVFHHYSPSSISLQCGFLNIVLGKPSFVKKKIFCEIISLTGGGGLTDFIPLFYFSKHPSNTLQTPCNTLQTPLKHPSTPFKPFKIIFFFVQKMIEKKINRDFIKGGRGGGHHFMKWFHKKSFFSQLMASLSFASLFILFPSPTNDTK